MVRCDIIQAIGEGRMLRLKDIMSRDVLTFDENLSVRDAMQSLVSHHMSGAPVVSGDHVVGVISTTDLLEFAAGLPGAPIDRPEERDTASDGDVSDGLDEDENLSSFFLDSWDDRGADSVTRIAAVNGSEYDMLEQYTVSESMTRAPICSLPSHAPVTEAAEYMGRAAVHRILVVDNGRIVGIVTASDVARAAAEGKLGKWP